MPTYSANLSMMFPELPFLRRFAAARQAGFPAVEFWFPYAHAAAEIKAVLDGEDLRLVVINSAAGRAEQGEWGIAALAGRREDFIASLSMALDYAVALKASAVHVMAGNIGADGEAAAMARYLDCLELAVTRAEGSGVTLLVEPLNHRDRPGYLIGTSGTAAEVIGHFGVPHLKMMFDIYHVQIAEGDIIHRLRTCLPLIGHIQIAGVPNRQEPDAGELHYADILAEIDRTDYAGFVGCEYTPRGDTVSGLYWREKFSAKY